MKTKILYISASVALLILFSVFYFPKSPTPEQTPKPAPEQITHQKCPDDYPYNYAGEVEYQKAFIQWIFDFYDTHPGATYSDQLAARLQFLTDNNCTAALQRYTEADMKSVAMGIIDRGGKENIDYTKLTPDLDKICPFYEPNGAYYRECVFNQLDKESAKFDLESEMYKEIESYCEYNAVRGADWYSLAFISDYSACVYYKLKLAE